MPSPLERVWDEPHTTANVCGVVTTICDTVTERKKRRRVELVLVDATHRITCVFWGDAAVSTSRRVALLDVVIVRVHDSRREGRELSCQCRLAARVAWRATVGDGDAASLPAAARAVVAWATESHPRIFEALRRAAARSTPLPTTESAADRRK